MLGSKNDKPGESQNSAPAPKVVPAPAPTGGVNLSSEEEDDLPF